MQVQAAEQPSSAAAAGGESAEADISMSDERTEQQREEDDLEAEIAEAFEGADTGVVEEDEVEKEDDERCVPRTLLLPSAPVSFHVTPATFLHAPRTLKTRDAAAPTRTLSGCSVQHEVEEHQKAAAQVRSAIKQKMGKGGDKHSVLRDILTQSEAYTSYMLARSCRRNASFTDEPKQPCVVTRYSCCVTLRYGFVCVTAVLRCECVASHTCTCLQETSEEEPARGGG